MTYTKEPAEPLFEEALGMNDKEFEEWKEEVRMDAIKFPHHAHSWISNYGSLPARF